MKNKTNLSVEDIAKLSYTDFIGLVNQWNVLPGSYNTLSKWKVFSDITKKSSILEVACTTGFSSRELALMTGCSGVGIDISGPSVDKATYNMSHYAPSIKMKYFAIDGYAYTSKKKFSHIIFGAALRFFPDPEKMLAHSLSMLKDKGYILASEFYVTKEIPKSLVNEARKVFGITVTQASYKDVMEIYEGLEILYEDKNVIVSETKKELAHYTKSTIDRACEMLDISDKKIYDALYKRLYIIKEMSNKLRPYQNYNVLVMRYSVATYPRRFTELF